jgi:hypothetical protein
MRSYSMGHIQIQLADSLRAHCGMGIIKLAELDLTLSAGINTTTTFSRTWRYTFGIGQPNR